jgi:FkbM family methyltransferase
MIHVCEGHRIDFDRMPNVPLVVDAGACQGTFMDFVNQYGSSEMYAIEPCKSHVTRLKAKYPKIEIYNKALVGSRGPDVVKFYEYVGMPKWASTYDRRHAVKNHPKLRDILEYDVKTIRISDIFKVLCVDHIDYLKLDIEGAEFDVFYSMDTDISSKIYQFSAEIHKIDKNESDIKDLIKYVKRLGYKCEWFQTKSELWGYRK